ncbi:hypothetical protein MYCOZU2_05164 [Mycobacterium intracellulare subsp. chimaera]|uniref:Uncharacterized protein n=1 Tax=Mycobacterium intracellulare subsp. chimaera TaxID=222805 RepID=A0A7U5MPW5_MYCIT|nr:hypothetical protein MYCOZU2_05164 [Mycobacterium intracellulare subsp. chimaera]
MNTASPNFEIVMIRLLFKRSGEPWRGAFHASSPTRLLGNNAAQGPRQSEVQPVEYGSFQEEMSVAFPCETDSAIDLYQLTSDFDVALGDVRFGKRGILDSFCGLAIEDVCCIPVEALRGLSCHIHVGKLMLDRLEGSDRNAKLFASLNVFDGEIYAPR